MKHLLPYLLGGALFGFGLALSGMTDPARVLGFLDLAGRWDPTLAFVMGGALLSFGVGSRLVQRRRCPVAGGSFPGAPERKLDPRLFLGAALFGVGWGVAGLCPGPALAGLGFPRTASLIFVPAMIAGMLVAQRAFGVDRPAPSKAQGSRASSAR